MRKLVKENKYLKLDKESEYWIGMLSTDGSIYKTRISLRQNNLEIITKYKRFLGNKVKIFEVKKDKYIQYAVQYRCKETVNILHKLGITENKSFTLELKIPITKHILRGIIDGDGCFINKGYQRACRITTGSEKFKNQICKYLFKNSIRYREWKEKNVYRIQINRQESLLKLIDLIYTDANVYIEEKHCKAQDIRNYIYNKLSNSGNQHQESRAKPDKGRCRDWTAATLTSDVEGKGTVRPEKTGC